MKKRTLFIVFAVLFLFAVGGWGGYIIVTPTEREEEAGPTQITEPVAQPKEATVQPEKISSRSQKPTTTEAIDTSKWRIYGDSELGISFKYPKEWNLKPCMKLIKGGRSRVSAFNTPECNVWVDFVDELFFYKFTPGIPLKDYFLEQLPTPYSIPYFFDEASGLIDCKTVKISTGQKGVMLDGYTCHHEPCPPTGPCGDVPPLSYCVVAGRKWGRKCSENDIIKKIYAQTGTKKLRHYLEERCLSCEEENKAELQIFDKFVDGIQIR